MQQSGRRRWHFCRRRRRGLGHSGQGLWPGSPRNVGASPDADGQGRRRGHGWLQDGEVIAMVAAALPRRAPGNTPRSSTILSETVCSPGTQRPASTVSRIGRRLVGIILMRADALGLRSRTWAVVPVRIFPKHGESPPSLPGDRFAPAHTRPPGRRHTTRKARLEPGRVGLCDCCPGRS